MKKSVLFSALLIAFMASAVFAQAPALPELADDHTMFCVTPLYEDISNPTYLTGYTLFQKSHKNYDASTDLCVSYWYIPEDYRNKEGGFDAPPEVSMVVDKIAYYDMRTFLDYLSVDGRVLVQGAISFGDTTDYKNANVAACKTFEENNLAFQGKYLDLGGGTFEGAQNSSLQHICYISQDTDIFFLNSVNQMMQVDNLTFDDVYFRSTLTTGSHVGLYSYNQSAILTSNIRVFNSRFEGSTVGAIVSESEQPIENVYIENVIVATNGSYSGVDMNVGGVVGRLNCSMGCNIQNDTLVNVQVLDNADVTAAEDPESGEFLGEKKFVGGVSGYALGAGVSQLVLDSVSVSSLGNANAGSDGSDNGAGGKIFAGGVVGFGTRMQEWNGISAKDVSVLVNGSASSFEYDDTFYGGTLSVGGFLGYVMNSEDLHFEDVTGDAVTVSVSDKNGGYDEQISVGGVVGYASDYPLIALSIVLKNSSVINGASSKKNYVGGFAGYSVFSENASMTLVDLNLEMDVSQAKTAASNSTYVGGLLGFYKVDVDYSAENAIENVIFNGKVSSLCAENLYVGGAIGRLDFSGAYIPPTKNILIRKFEFNGDVDAGTCNNAVYVGGLVGEVDGSGLIPVPGSSASMGIKVQNTYTVGNIVASNSTTAGYLVGAITQPDADDLRQGEYTANISIWNNYHYGESDASVSSPLGTNSCEVILEYSKEGSANTRNLCDGDWNSSKLVGLGQTYRNGTPTGEYSLAKLPDAGLLNGADMKTDLFAAALNNNDGEDEYYGVWSRKDDVNDGLPIFGDYDQGIYAVYRLEFDVSGYVSKNCPDCEDDAEKVEFAKTALGDNIVVYAKNPENVYAYIANTYQGTVQSDDYDKLMSINDKGMWVTDYGVEPVVLGKREYFYAPVSYYPSPYETEYPVVYYLRIYDPEGSFAETRITESAGKYFASPAITTYHMDDEESLIPLLFYQGDVDTLYRADEIAWTQGALDEYGNYEGEATEEETGHYSRFSEIRGIFRGGEFNPDTLRIYYTNGHLVELPHATVFNRDENMPFYEVANGYVFGTDEIQYLGRYDNPLAPLENEQFPFAATWNFVPDFGYNVTGYDVDFAIVAAESNMNCADKDAFDIDDERTYTLLASDKYMADENAFLNAFNDAYSRSDACQSTVFHIELGAEDSLYLDKFMMAYKSGTPTFGVTFEVYVTPKYNFVEYAIDFVRPTSEEFFVFSDYLGENWLESVSYTKENEDALILDARRFVTTYGNASGWAENKNAAQIDWAHNLSHLENIFTPTETEKTFYPVSCEFTSLTDKSCLESDDVVVGNYAFTLKTDGNGTVELWQIIGADNATTGAKADTIRHQFTAVAGAENTFEMLVPKLKDDAGGNDYMPFVFEIHAIPADDYAGGTYKLSYSVDGGAYESLKNGDIFAETEPENLVFDVSFKKPQINRAMFTFKAVDGTEQVFYGDDRVDDGEIFDYLEASGKTEFEKIVYTSGKCLAGWAVAENPVDGESLYNFFDENLGVALKAAYPEAKTSEYTLYARWTDDLSKCAAGANAFTRISHEGEHGMVALGISDGANTVVHEFTSSNTMLVPTGLDVSLITFEEMPESGYALDSIAVKIGSQTVVRMPTDKLPNNYADAILRSYFSKVNLEARFAFVMGSKKDSVLYGDDWKKDFGVFNSVDEKKLPTMLYTVGECLEGWSVQNAQGEKYDIFDKQMGLKLEELNPDAHNSYSLYANWTDDLSMCAAGADAFTRVSYKSKHGAVTLQDTVTNMVYAFAPNRTMVLPSNTNGAAMKAFVDVEPGYALDSLVVKFDNKSIALKPGDNLPKNIVNATIWAYFSEDLKIPVEFVSPKVQLSGNALRFAFSTTEFRIDGQALVSILLENEKGWKARQKFDVKTVPYNESWKKFYLPSGDYVLTAKLINGADTVEFKKDSIVVESEIKSAGPDGWQMVSLYSVEMNEYRHDDDAVFYWWDESSSAGDFWHYKELGFTPVKRGVGYWYNSIEGRGLKLRDASDKDSVLASSAYWDLDSVYSGWNLVANPNGFKIDVSTSPDYYDEMEFLRWNTEAGEYEPVKVLDPYEAVWVKVNDKSRFALPDRPLFAEDGGNALQKSGEARTLAKASGKDNWTLQVVLADNNGKRDSYNMIGVGKKRLSVEEPPEGMGEHVALSFVEGKKSLAKSVKAPADEVEWTMELKANSNRMGSLSLDGVGKLNAMGLKVFVTVDGKTTEISEGQKLNVALSSKSKFATVRVAEKARVTVAGQLDGFKAVKVGSGLQVSFNADQDLAGARARVDLVDMKGHVVASAAATTLAGANSVTLTAPKPGLYMVRVRAGSQMGAGKVVVK